MNCPKCQFVLPDDKAAECPFCHAGLKAGPAAAPPPVAALPPIPQFQAPPAGAPPPRAAVPPPSTATPRPLVPPPSVATPRPMVPPPMVPPLGLTPPAGAPGQSAPPGAIPPFGGPPPQYPPVGGAPGIPPAPIPGAPPPGAPGIAPPGFPGLMPPSMPQQQPPKASAPGIPTPNVNPDPLNLEGLHRTHEPQLDPLADPLAQMKQAPPPQPASPTPGVGMPSKGEIEWEAPPPPKSGGKKFLLFGILALVGVGWRTGFLSLDVFYGMLSKGTAPAPGFEPLPPAGQQTGVARPGHQEWNLPQPTPSKGPVAPEPEPTPEPTEAPKPVELWTFEGRLYDMMTLRPVFAAELRFEARGEKPVSAQTDERGRYKVKVPALEEGSYQIAIVHPDYDGKKYFDEISPPYRNLEEEERKALVRLIPRHKPWAGKVGGKIRRDLVLLPATHHIESTDKPANVKPEGDAPPEEAQ